MSAHRFSRRTLFGAAAAPLAAALAGCRRRQPAPPFDVCVIGSGFAGTFLALRLAESGARIAIVEAGPRLAAEAAPAGRVDRLPIDGAGDAGFDVDFTRTIGLGGTSRRWSGVVTRLFPGDFEGASSSAPPWPLRYAEIEPYYCRAETLLGVRGGRLQRDAEPPRNCPYPFVRKRYTSPSRLFPDRELSFFLLPFASRGGEGPVRLDELEIPKLEAMAGVTLLLERTATELLVDGGGRATGLVIASPAGATEVLSARHFVVAAGVAETARLLLASRSDVFPAGLGNRSGWVGSHLTAHPAYRFEAAQRPGLEPAGGIHRTYSYAPSLRAAGLGAAHADVHLDRRQAMVEMMLETEGVAGNRFEVGSDGRARLTVDWTERDRRTIERCGELGSAMVRDLSPPGAKIRTRRPLWFHPAGLCRMAGQESGGVVDRAGRVYGTTNVHLAGAAIFPRPGTANPTLTVVALALRLADRLAELMLL